MGYGAMYAGKIDLLFESALLLAAVAFSLSVYVLSRGVSNKLHIAYSVLTFVVSGWSFAFFMANVLNLRFFESIHILSTLLLAPVSLLFLNVLLRPEGAFYRWLLRLSVGTPLLLFLPVTFGFDRYFWIKGLSYFSPVLIVVAGLYLLLSESFGAVKPRGEGLNFSLLSSTEMFQALKRRNIWIYLGGMSGTLLGVMDHVPWMGRTIPAIGNFLLVIYLYFLKDAILHRSLVSQRRTVGRLLANTFGAVVLFLIFIMITRWVQGNAFLYLTNAFLAAFVAVVSLDPVRSIVNFLFQKFFFTEASRVDALIKESSKEIAGAFHSEAIAEATGKFLEKTMSSAMISFYAIDADGKKFQKIVDATPERKLPTILPPSFPLIQHWALARGWHPILDVELEAESQRAAIATRVTTLQLTLDALRSLQSTMALPLLYNKSVLGFVTLAATEPPEIWEDSWAILSLIGPYFARAGEALHELDIYARLRERDRLATIGEMAAGLAHEIRNPLGAIKGAAQVMEVKAGDPNEPFLKIIVEEVNRLNGVVTQFLNYAKPFQGEFVYADLGQLVEQGVERFRKQKNTDFQLNFVQLTQISPVLCQPGLISQVLTNLLENAYRALSKKSPAISVSLAHNIRDDGNSEIILRVKDNGVGMSRQMLDKIFIPFFTSSPQGTGLGLSICQKIAEAHGGRMEAESTLGEGTVMTLRFVTKQKE